MSLALEVIESFKGNKPSKIEEGVLAMPSIKVSPKDIALLVKSQNLGGLFHDVTGKIDKEYELDEYKVVEIKPGRVTIANRSGTNYFVATIGTKRNVIEMVMMTSDVVKGLNSL